MIKDPEPGDFVKLNGRILSIDEGVALVEVYRSYPVGLRVPVQCGALEHVEPEADDGVERADTPDELQRVADQMEAANFW